MKVVPFDAQLLQYNEYKHVINVHALTYLCYLDQFPQNDALLLWHFWRTYFMQDPVMQLFIHNEHRKDRKIVIILAMFVLMVRIRV